MHRCAAVGLLYIALVGGCRPSSTDEEQPRGAPAEGPEPSPTSEEPTPPRLQPEPTLAEQEPRPTPGEPILHIDPRMPAKLGALDGFAGIPTAVCDEADEHPLDCGFAEVCREFGPRWARQIEREFGDLPAMVAEVDQLDYPESCTTPREPSTSPDFAAHAALVRHNVMGNLVGGLFTYEGGRYRGRARLIESVVSGMAWMSTYEPVAAWERDIDGQPGRELIVLVRGDESGHAEDLDPYVRAHLILCGTSPRTSTDQGPWCGRVAVGVWIDDREVGRGREPGWVTEIDIHLNELVLSSAVARKSRTMTLTELARADLRLIPG